MDRRSFISTLAGGLLAAPLAAEAQQADRVARIGYQAFDLSAANPLTREGFFQGLRDVGYVECRNLLVEYRDAEGKTERFPALAAELVALKLDVIVSAGGTLAALAAKQATTTLPIVFTGVGDPVEERVLRDPAAMSRACPSSPGSLSASR